MTTLDHKEEKKAIQQQSGAAYILDAYQEFTVTRNFPTLKNKNVHTRPGKKINIILGEVAHKSLPYVGDIVLPFLGKRETVTRIVFRNDDKDPREVMENGGIFPKITLSTEPTKFEPNALSVAKHRISSDGSTFISTSNSLEQVKAYSGAAIYLLEVSGAITPSPFDKYREKEFSVIAGVDKNKIPGFREFPSTRDRFKDARIEDNSFCGTSIFLSKTFMEKHPLVWPDLIKSLLEPDEVCLISRPRPLSTHAIVMQDLKSTRSELARKIKEDTGTLDEAEFLNPSSSQPTSSHDDFLSNPTLELLRDDDDEPFSPPCCVTS